MNRTERLYAIVEELRRAGSVGRTSTWLADRFEVSTRTIKRDMAALLEAGTPLEADEGRGGGYRLAKHGALAPLAFTSGEAAAIVVAIAAEPGLPFLLEARSALARVLGAMTGDQRREVDDLCQRIWVAQGARPSRGVAAKVLDQAILERRVVLIDYTNGEGAETLRRAVEPLAFARTRDHWHLMAWCRLRQAGRWFRLDRVQRASLTSERVPIRDLEEVFGSPPQFARPVRVSLA